MFNIVEKIKRLSHFVSKLESNHPAKEDWKYVLWNLMEIEAFCKKEPIALPVTDSGGLPIEVYVEPHKIKAWYAWDVKKWYKAGTREELVEPIERWFYRTPEMKIYCVDYID